MYRNSPRGVWRGAGAHAACLFVLTLLYTPQAQANQELSGVVNLNEAPAAQLVLLPGIGAEKAARIVTYRAKRKFKRTVELARVRGIGLRTVRRLKSFLAVEGPSTLHRTGRPRSGGQGHALKDTGSNLGGPSRQLAGPPRRW